MDISYCFTSPEGDVPVDDATLERPFILRPFENHPFMALGDYFSAVRDFIFHDKGKSLVHLLTHLWDIKVELKDITKTIIRYEKYGTLYQIVSAEIFCLGRQIKFAVSTAISDEAKETLNREFDLIQHLYFQKGLSCLPRAYYKYTMGLRNEEMTETILMTMSQWFENYHEWHFSKDENNVEHILIWDTGGYRLASNHESYEVIKQSSKILALYYDPDNYCRIYPWHHGAGDFVVRTVDGSVDVKLVTIRGYEPIVFTGTEEKADAMKALILFLFDTTIKMRLDKYEGVGETYWAEPSILNAVLEGFLDALKTKELHNDLPGLKFKDFIDKVISLDKDEMEVLFSLCIDQYSINDPSDCLIIRNHIKKHISDIYRVFQNYVK